MRRSRRDARLRKWEILGKKETQKLNPALRGNYIASLWCPLDGTVEPDSVLTSLRNHLQTNSRYIWRNSVDIIDIKSAGDRVTAVAKSGESLKVIYLFIALVQITVQYLKSNLIQRQFEKSTYK